MPTLKRRLVQICHISKKSLRHRFETMIFGGAEIVDGVVRILSVGGLFTTLPLHASRRQFLADINFEKNKGEKLSRTAYREVKRVEINHGD